MKYIDLHIHTTASDGLYTPEELVDVAIDSRLSAIAVTDHDNIGNCAEVVSLGKEKGIEVVPGVEISVDDDEFGLKDIHVMGLFIDYENPGLIEELEKIGAERFKQKVAIVNRLQELGYEISVDEVRELAKGALGRPHIAMVLMKNHPDEFPSMEKVFKELLGTGKPAHMARTDKTSLRKAIGLIKNAKGLAILCHPALYVNNDIDVLIDKFIELGGDGIETYYPYDKFKVYKGISKVELDKIIQKYKEIAEEKGLIESGGSDCHGTGIVDLGAAHVPYSVLENLKEKLR